MVLRQGNAGGSVLRGQNLTFIQTSIVCQPRCDFLALAPEAGQKQQTAKRLQVSQVQKPASLIPTPIVTRMLCTES